MTDMYQLRRIHLEERHAVKVLLPQEVLFFRGIQRFDCALNINLG